MNVEQATETPNMAEPKNSASLGSSVAPCYVFTEDDIDSCWPHYKVYLIEILNGEYTVDAAREDLKSLIGSKYDCRT